MDNQTIAKHLRQHARELEAEGGNLYRVRAYRRAADFVAGRDQPIECVLQQTGRRGLRELPGIGSHIALALENLLHTGHIKPLAA
jgi:DNA polymerase (family 10)